MVSRLSFLFSFVFCFLNAQQTYVPDDGFEQHLIYYGYDDVLDNYVLTSNINTIEDLALHSYLYNIENLTGLEDFVNLKNFHISGMDADEIDLSNNNLLETVILSALNITQIDFSNNLLLEEIFVGAPLTQIDLSHNTNLKKVTFINNQFLEIDFTNNPLLEDIYISDTPITQIDINQNTNLKKVKLEHNQLSEIDFSNDLSLEDVLIRGNPITQITFNQNLNLKTFELHDSLMTEIDFNNAPSLESLYLNANFLLTDLNFANNSLLSFLAVYQSALTTINTNNLQLLEDIVVRWTPSFRHINLANNPNLSSAHFIDNEAMEYLNVQNGNNINFDYFTATGTPNLNCIQVDDPVWSENNWDNVDNHISFETYCEFILNTNDIKSPENFKFYPNPVENTLTIENPDLTIDKINLIDANGKTVLTESRNTNPIKINLKSYPKGIYFLQLFLGEKLIDTKKIMKK